MVADATHGQSTKDSNFNADSRVYPGFWWALTAPGNWKHVLSLQCADYGVQRHSSKLLNWTGIDGIRKTGTSTHYGFAYGLGSKVGGTTRKMTSDDPGSISTLYSGYTQRILSITTEYFVFIRTRHWKAIRSSLQTTLVPLWKSSIFRRRGWM